MFQGKFTFLFPDLSCAPLVGGIKYLALFRRVLKESDQNSSFLTVNLHQDFIHQEYTYVSWERGKCRKIMIPTYTTCEMLTNTENTIWMFPKIGVQYPKMDGL